MWAYCFIVSSVVCTTLGFGLFARFCLYSSSRTMEAKIRGVDSSLELLSYVLIYFSSLNMIERKYEKKDMDM